MIIASPVPFGAIQYGKQPDSISEYIFKSPGAADSLQDIYEVIEGSYYLQSTLSRMEKFDRYQEVIPIADLSAYQMHIIEKIFIRTKEIDFFGRAAILAEGAAPEAAAAWERLKANAAANPFLLHFAYTHANNAVPDTMEDEAYLLVADKCDCNSEVRAHVRRQMEIQNASWNLPAIDASGWSLEEICNDSLVEDIICSVHKLYYCRFPQICKPFAQQLRFTL